LKDSFDPIAFIPVT